MPLCTTGVLDEDDLYYIPADTDSTDTLSGWVPDDVIWKDRTDLSVKFLTRIPDHWTYDGSEMNTGNIMSWANLWHHRGDGIVPKFTRVRDQSVHSDIRVKFESKSSRFNSLKPRPPHVGLALTVCVCIGFSVY